MRSLPPGNDPMRQSMLNAVEMNTILEGLFDVLEAKIPTLAPLTIGKLAPVMTTGAYGSVILGALFTGDLEGKLTLTLEWETAFLIAEVLLQSKAEGFSKESQEVVEGLFAEALRQVLQKFQSQGLNLEIHPLPLLTDADVLLSEQGNPGALRLSLSHATDEISLYFSIRNRTKKAA